MDAARYAAGKQVDANRRSRQRENDEQQNRKQNDDPSLSLTEVSGPAIDLPPGPLNARQVLQLQRLVGNQAVQRMLAERGQIPVLSARKGIIQRNVGFEFEVGGYQVEQMNQNMTPGQFAGTTQILPAELDDANLTKADVLARQTGVEMQIDEGAHDFHLEFVTTGVGFPESSDGRDQLKTAMENMEGLSREVTAKGNAPGSTLNTGGGTTRLVQSGEVTGGVPTKPETVIHSGGGAMTAEPQTTAGIRLDQIPALMENMARPQGEAPQETQERSPQRATLAGKSGAADTAAMREAAPAARTAIGNFRTLMANAHVALPGDFGSESLVGLMALIYTYLKKGTVRVNDYPKSLFPMLGITNFGAMYGMLPANDRAPFTGNAQRFVDINLDAAGMAGTGGTAFFAGGFAAQLTNMTLLESQQTALALGAITRQQWLSGIVGGVDELTKAQSNVDALESMGKLNRGETVGDTHLFRRDTETDAPILELRRLAGNVGVNNWKDLALDIFDFIVKLNDLKTDRFKSRRYDFNNPR